MESLKYIAGDNNAKSLSKIIPAKMRMSQCIFGNLHLKKFKKESHKLFRIRRRDNTTILRIPTGPTGRIKCFASAYNIYSDLKFTTIQEYKMRKIPSITLLRFNKTPKLSDYN